jgi:hypothetical protein
LRALPGVRFVTASELPAIYPDGLRTQGAPERDLEELAARLTRQSALVDFQVIGERAYSAADQFELLTVAVSSLIEGKSVRFPPRLERPRGRHRPPRARPGPARLRWSAFRDATLDVRDYLQAEGRVPARIFIGADAVSPTDFMTGLARAYEHYLKEGKLPLEEGVELGRNVELSPERCVAKDTPELFGGWIIHKEGFRAPRILDVARQQTWTLKPALRRQ